MMLGELDQPQSGASAHNLDSNPGGRVNGGRQDMAPSPWVSKDVTGAYVELEHPADLMIEIRGSTREELFENALYALYSITADLAVVSCRDTISIVIETDSLAGALRDLLAEGLYRLSVESFIAAAAEVSVSTESVTSPGLVLVKAQLWGEHLNDTPEAFLTEVKAVTYHRLAVEQEADGEWRATVLFDV